MPEMIPDKTLDFFGATETDKRDFYIAWLNQRVNNLETMVFALMEGKADGELIEAYRELLKGPPLPASSIAIKKRGAMIVATMKTDD